MFTDLILGFLFIGVGIWSIWDTYKNPAKILWSSNFKGYIGGGMAIILGFYLILN